MTRTSALLSLAALLTSILLTVLPGYGLVTDPNCAAGLTGANKFHFTENRGQWDERVLFKAEGTGGLTWWIERDGFTLLYSIPDLSAPPLEDPRRLGFQPDDGQDARSTEPPRYPFIGHALKFKYMEMQSGEWRVPNIPVIPSSSSSDRLSWNSNYFLGSDPAKWAPNCANFRRITQPDVWEGIAVNWYQENGFFEFDFAARPGADLSQIGLQIEGLTGEIGVTADGGELILPTSIGDLRLALPEAFQLGASGEKIPLDIQFEVSRSGVVSLSVPEGLDEGRAIVVDPLVYSTYLGGGDEDYATALCPDGAGSVVAAGLTGSNNFPTTAGAYDRSLNRYHDLFLARLNADGSELIYGAYLGGGDYERATALCPDGAGGVVVAGHTQSNNFPTTEGAYDRSFNGGFEAIIARLSADGSELIYGTYLGGESHDQAWALCPDGAGGVVVTGVTYSDNFPITEGAYDRSFNGGELDAFIARLSADGSELIYGTYLGGGGEDNTLALCPDGAGGVVVAGQTESNNYPTTDGAYDQSFNGGYDAFIARLSADGSELIYGTYLGGSNNDYAFALCPDGAGGVVAAGQAYSNNFPTTDGAYDRSFNGTYDAFIARLNSDGSELIYGTYLGGGDHDYVDALCPDGAGGVVAAGLTCSNNFPTTEGAYDRSYNEGYDAFIARLSADGSEFVYGTYLGGGNYDRVLALCPDGAGGIAAAGVTNSNDFPTTEGAYDRSINGDWDAFIARLSGDGGDLIYSTYLGGSNSDYAYALCPDGAGGVVATGYTYSNNFPTTEGAYDRSFDGDTDPFITNFDDFGATLQWVLLPPPALQATERDVIRFPIRAERFQYLQDVQMTFSLAGDLPETAEIVDNGDGSATFNWRPEYGDAGLYIGQVTCTDGVQEISADFAIGVKYLFHAPLRQGWNIVSSDVPPADPEQTAVWREIAERGVLTTVKDQAGRFYRPALNYNGVPPWNIGQGYMAKLEAADTLVIPGDPVAANRPIPLRQGWNICAYFPEAALTAPEAFANLGDRVEMVKDEAGRFYVYAIGYSNMGRLTRGKGYQIKVREECELVYPVGEMIMMTGDVDQEEEGYWRAARSDRNMSLLIEDCRLQLEDWGEIGAFTASGLCVGAAKLQTSNSRLQTGLAVWGDDPTTDAVDGLRAGEEFTLKFWDASTGETSYLQTQKLVYEPDGFTEVTASASSIVPDHFYLTQNYPNPFNGTTRISFGLPQAGSVKVGVYDLSGREVAKLVRGSLRAGIHEVTWQAEGLSSGIYLVKMEAAGYNQTRKIMLIR